MGGILTVMLTREHWMIGLVGLFMGQIVYLFILYIYGIATRQPIDSLLRTGISEISLFMLIPVASAWGTLWFMTRKGQDVL